MTVIIPRYRKGKVGSCDADGHLIHDVDDVLYATYLLIIFKAWWQVYDDDDAEYGLYMFIIYDINIRRYDGDDRWYAIFRAEYNLVAAASQAFYSMIIYK